MEENTYPLWWGYLHVSLSVQVKRYFGPKDIQEAQESDFVIRTCGPFKARNREEAMDTAGHQL